MEKSLQILSEKNVKSLNVWFDYSFGNDYLPKQNKTKTRNGFKVLDFFFFF